MKFVRILKNVSVLMLALFVFAACEEEENKDQPSEVGGMACTYYVDQTTYAYFECTDFTESDYSLAEFQAVCSQQNSGQVSVSCAESYVFESRTYPSTGSCAYSSGGTDLESRWYYVVEGNGPSETAICTTLSGTFTAD